MTPSPANNDDQPRQATDDADVVNEKIEQVSLETPVDLRDETALVEKSDSVNELTRDILPDEVAQAREAIAFLKEVRAETRRSSQLPATIGKYSIVRSLGRGGFAEVFLAEDEELDRRVALKVPLFDSTTNEAGRQRFEREAKLAASLGHPQIVPVYEYGDLGPVRFIAFAWCDGPNLTDWIANNGSVDFETAAKMVHCLAEAVQHAHQRGIVHRDLKPGNVLVDNSEESKDKPVWERLRITDFGLARNFDSHDATLTQDGQLLGTPAYMAPEQAGSGADVGPAADIWSLGMILLELLTGQLPFRKPEILATIKAICDDSVPRARKLRPDVPSGLDAITNLCLRKNPRDRYESAHDLSEDLRRWSSGEPVKAKPQTSLSTFAMWIRRNPALAGLIGLTIASLTIGLGVSIWQRNVAMVNLREATAQTDRADDNRDNAQYLISAIIDVEKSLGIEKAGTDERIEMLKRASSMQVALNEDEERTPQVRYSTANTFRSLSEMLIRLGDYEAAIDNAQYVLEQLEGLEDELPEKITHEDIYKNRVLQRMKMSDSLNSLGQYDEAIKLIEANESEPIPDEMDPFLVTVIRVENLRARSFIETSRSDSEGAAETLQLALERLATAYPSDDKKQLWDWSLTHCRIGFALSDLKMGLQDWDGVETLLTESGKHLRSLKEYFPKHPMIKQNEGELLYRRGGLHECREQWDLAIEQYRDCHENRLWQLNTNPGFPTLAQNYLKSSIALARCHQQNDSLKESQRLASQAVARAASFPKKWNADPSFKEDLQQLKRLADGP